MPSSSARLAPPPVETWLKRSTKPNFFAAAAESPPPTMVRASAPTLATGTMRAQLSGMIEDPDALEEALMLTPYSRFMHLEGRPLPLGVGRDVACLRKGRPVAP